MDWKFLKDRMEELIRKYKYVCLILVIGIVLMSFPTDSQEPCTDLAPAAPQRQTELAEEIAEILAKTEGVGRVDVLLTEAEGVQTVYQTDNDTSSDGSVRTETVIISAENRVQSGLVRTVTPPVYLGAIVVCQGADSPVIRLEIVRAVSGITGIPSDRISVLKMK